MKKSYLLFAVMLSLTFKVNAQIIIASNEMPHSGDTARLTKAVINPFLNYGATGANHNWNFTNLKADVQELRNFKSVSSTGLLYSIVFADIFFNPNRANVATAGTFTLPANNYLTLDNPYNFYYRNSSQYKQVGIGSDITAFNIPLGGIPNTFDQQDIIYNLPLNYGDQDTSNSAYHISIPLVPISYAFRQIRMNNVDGWGTLLTPHGTYDVLRVKTTLQAHDSLGFDTLGIPPIEIDRPEANEYKWLAVGERVPILQINTQTIFGLELITEIFFRDDFLNVYPNSGLNTAYCAGSAISIPYTAEGTFNSGLFFNNQFRAQLSDASGSFANPVQIGQVTSNISGTINATIPANTNEGSGYRIRIVSTSPAMEGPDNGSDIYIATQPVSAITANAGLSICDSMNVMLSAIAGNGYAYQWQLNGIDITGATAVNYIASQQGDYRVVTTNQCGSATSNILQVNQLTAPNAIIASAVSFICQGDSTLLSVTYENGNFYQWFLDGNIIASATDSMMYALLPGNYSLVASNGVCADVTSNIISLNSVNLPTAVITSISNNTICLGDSVLLSETTLSGLNYQWQLDGTDISGATAADYVAFQTGDYTIIATNNCGSISSNIIHVDVSSPPIAVLMSGNTSFCAGDSLLLNATYQSGNSYQWLLDGIIAIGANDTIMYATQAGTYTVIVIGNGMCPSDTSNSILLNMLTAPAPNITASANTSFCAGDSVILNETTASGTSYQWQLNAADITGATSASYTVTQSGNYNVVASNVCGNSMSNNINVVINPLPVTPLIIQNIDSLITTLAVNYQWFFNGVMITGANSQYYIPTQNGDYTVVISDTNGCLNISTVFSFNSVGINESATTYMVNVTPNPATDFFNLDFSSEKATTISVSLLSATGAEVILLQTKRILSGVNHLAFDIKQLSLSGGIYFVKFESDHKMIYKKLVKI